MRRSKTLRWQENRTFSCVHQPPVAEVAAAGSYNRGRWAREILHTRGPITLELGCGGAETTLALARRDPTRGFVGVDIKGHRFWHAAKTVEVEGLGNVAFLRARIEYIDHYFGPGEVGDIWLTFSDPQPKNTKGTKRLTSPIFLRRYARMQVPKARVHIKTDSDDLFALAQKEPPEAGYEITRIVADIHAPLPTNFPADLAEILSVKTRYERKWLARGKRIHYVQLMRSPVNDQ